MMRRCLAAVIGGTVSLTFSVSAIGTAGAGNATLANVTSQTLAQGPVQAFPKGKIFLSILEWRLPSGNAYGPHSHSPLIAYDVTGVATIAYPRATAVRPSHAIFIPADSKGNPLVAFQNLDGRIGAAAIAVGLIVLVLLLCAATWLRGRARRLSIAGLSVLLIAGGAYPLTIAPTNDFFVMAVRAENLRTIPMPRPDGHVLWSSPDVDPVPAGPYVETLVAITVPAGARYDAPASLGPQMILVIEGAAQAQIGGVATELGHGDAAMAQTGQTLAIINRGSSTLRFVDFVVTPGPAST